MLMFISHGMFAVSTWKIVTDVFKECVVIILRVRIIGIFS